MSGRTAIRRRDARRAAALAAGLGAVAAVLSPPFERLAAERFAAHMLQHLLLILVAAPLLAVGRPVAVARQALPPRAARALHRLTPAPVRRTGRRLRHPVVVWVLGTAVLWGWHLPAPYQQALRSDTAHAAEHAMFLGAAGLFWSVVLRAGRSRAAPEPAAARPAAVALVFATALASGALGAVLTFAGAPLYPAQAAVAEAAGADPLVDQQQAGALMWMPPGLVYLAVMTTLAVRWFGELDRRCEPDRRAPMTEGEAGG